jgi:hypothetical protein
VASERRQRLLVVDDLRRLGRIVVGTVAVQQLLQAELSDEGVATGLRRGETQVRSGGGYHRHALCLRHRTIGNLVSDCSYH